jgi:hypothetical protein
MSYLVRLPVWIEVYADEAPADPEAFAKDAAEDGSANLVVVGPAETTCVDCGLGPDHCGCVSDDEDARQLDNLQRARDIAA